VRSTALGQCFVAAGGKLRAILRSTFATAKAAQYYVAVLQLLKAAEKLQAKLYREFGRSRICKALAEGDTADEKTVPEQQRSGGESDAQPGGSQPPAAVKAQGHIFQVSVLASTLQPLRCCGCASVVHRPPCCTALLDAVQVLTVQPWPLG